MTPLEAARMLVVAPFMVYPGDNTEGGWDTEFGHCRFCDQGNYIQLPTHCVPKNIEHAPDCIWLAIPKIIAALEAAEQVVSAWQADIDRRGDEPISPVVRLAQLGGVFRSATALVSALKGDEVPA